MTLKAIVQCPFERVIIPGKITMRCWLPAGHEGRHEYQPPEPKLYHA